MRAQPMDSTDSWRRQRKAFWLRLLRRDQPEQGPIRLDRRRVYVLPTRAGMLFAGILLAMLLGAINYSNSLAFALTFTLASLSMVSILHTFRNIHGLVFRAGAPRPVFAGDDASFPIAMDNRDGPARFSISIRLDSRLGPSIDLPANQTVWREIAKGTRYRGRTALGRITVETRFPLGMVRAWAYVQPDITCLVYPRPADRHGLPLNTSSRGRDAGEKGSGTDDFAGLKDYQTGDSLRHVHWKAVARGQKMLVKQFGGENTDELWLDWDALEGMGAEKRLSVLCRWVLEAEASGLAYGLRLPAMHLAPSLGETHRHQCLEALALFDTPGGQR